MLYPEAIFIDINMPMMDGFQFIKSLQQINNAKVKKCKLIILTSSIYPEDKQKASEISKDIIFLNKPLTNSMLASI